MNIKVKKLRQDAKLPSHGSPSSAGYDLYACESEWCNHFVDSSMSRTASYKIRPHTTVLIPSGLAFELPDGYFAGLFARSGLATKKGLRPANCVSVCDADYRGEYMIPIHNDSDDIHYIEVGERIAQMIVLPCQLLEFEEVDELSSTDRGEGGFGSTGKS